MFIPERQREALMRLTMCARDECMMCIYQPKDDRCKDIATTAMHILANALKVDDDAPQTESTGSPIGDYRDGVGAWQTEPVGCTKGWSSSCTSCERYFSCDYLSGRHTDCGWGEPDE